MFVAASAAFLAAQTETPFTLNEPVHFSAAEIALLLIAVAISGGLFFYRLRPILTTVLRSKKDDDFSLHPLGKRVWLFFWEVLCQAKVIKQRPAPGIAHAFVFWGFLAFALVSTNHFFVGLRLGFLPPESLIGRFYFIFAGVWAVLVAVSIAGLFYRRFFIRPQWLGKKLSYESGFIAFLIFTLMVTYLGAFFTAAPLGLKALWWSHTMALLVFLPLIPHTKHLHLVLSPLTVFMKRDGFSKIPPLSQADDVEDFGLVTGKDVTQLIALQAYSCVECGRCTEHCPASTTGKVLNPKEIILGQRSYLKEFGPMSEVPLLNELRGDTANLSHDNRRRTTFPWKLPSSALPAAPASTSARWASSICRSSSVCAAAPPTPARGRTPMGRSSSSRSKRTAIRWGCRRPSATSSSRRSRRCSRSRSLTAHRSTACGWAAWAATIQKGAESSPTSRG